MAAWKSGDTIESHCVGTVVASRCGKYPNGTKVLGMMPWQNFAVLNGTKPFPSGPMEIPNVEGLAGKESLFLGIFGVTGLTGKLFLSKHFYIYIQRVAISKGTVFNWYLRLKLFSAEEFKLSNSYVMLLVYDISTNRPPVPHSHVGWNTEEHFHDFVKIPSGSFQETNLRD